VVRVGGALLGGDGRAAAHVLQPGVRGAGGGERGGAGGGAAGVRAVRGGVVLRARLPGSALEGGAQGRVRGAGRAV
ncbi:hypothetical protein TSOC_015347, partial [Tetrabaena socialis]